MNTIYEYKYVQSQIDYYNNKYDREQRMDNFTTWATITTLQLIVLIGLVCKYM